MVLTYLQLKRLRYGFMKFIESQGEDSDIDIFHEIQSMIRETPEWKKAKAANILYMSVLGSSPEAPAKFFNPVLAKALIDEARTAMKEGK